MKRIIGRRRLAALSVSTVALVLLAAGGSSAAVTTGAVTRTFSFIGKPGSSTVTVINIDSLLINARCDAKGNPIVFGFSQVASADLFGRVFDGLGRVHIIHDSSFINTSKGDLLTPTSGDYDSTATLLYETSTGKVVTVNFAFDNSTTLNKMRVCTVYGSLIAT